LKGSEKITSFDIFYLILRNNLDLTNSKQKSEEKQKTLKKCFDIYQGTWNKDDLMSESNHFKILQDFYEREQNVDNSESSYPDAYMNKIKKCKSNLNIFFLNNQKINYLKGKISYL
jgi:hypothetical protein